VNTFRGTNTHLAENHCQAMADNEFKTREPTARVTQCTWGQLTVSVPGEEVPRSFRDCKIWHDKACEWDWKATGTRHRPGIQMADLEEMLQAGVETVVLSRGVDSVLQTMPETLEELRVLGVTVIQVRTPEAVQRYNSLAASGASVGALLHSTC